MSELIVLHGCATVQLTRGLNALIDERDAGAIGYSTWFKTGADERPYAATRARIADKFVLFLMHRVVVLGVAGSIEYSCDVDHKNRDTLDNRRDNLRVATIGQNRANSRKKLWRGGKSSDYKGVSWHKRRCKWRAIIVKDKRQRELGFYDDEKDAARAYNRAALELHGEFACINEGV